MLYRLAGHAFVVGKFRFLPIDGTGEGMVYYYYIQLAGGLQYAYLSERHMAAVLY